MRTIFVDLKGYRTQFIIESGTLGIASRLIRDLNGDVAEAEAAADTAVAASNTAVAAAATAVAATENKADKDGGGNITLPATWRANLELGDSATRSVGTDAGTVAAGDDGRITGAAQKAANLSDVADAATARVNLDALKTDGSDVSDASIFRQNVGLAEFQTVALAEGATYPADPDAVRLKGYHAAADGGGADYSVETSDPGTSDAFEIAVGSPPVQRWLRRVHEEGGVDLIRHGVYGDAYDNALRDDTTRFLDAISLAADLGVNRVLGRGGKQFRLISGKVPANVEIDLRGGVIVASQLGVPLENGTINALYTEEADNVSVTICNGELDGGFTALGSSGYGDRVLDFKGGALVRLDRMVLHGTSNRTANASPPIDIFDEDSYRAGEVVILNAAVAEIHKCQFRSMAGEMLIVMSDDGSTILNVSNCSFDKRRDDNGASASNSGLSVFNIHPVSSVRDSRWGYFIQSAINALTNGMTFDGIYVNGASNSVGLDMNEATHVAFDGFVVRNGYFKDCLNGGVRTSARNAILENIRVEGGNYGIRIEGTTVGTSWAGSWFPAAGDRELTGIRIRQVITRGCDEASILINGASASDPAHVVVDGLQFDGAAGGLSPYGIDATNCHLTASGIVYDGSLANIRLSTSGSLTLDRAVLDPATTTGDCTILNNMPDGSVVTFNNSRREGGITAGKYDVAASGTTSAALTQVNINGGNGTLSAFPSAMTRILKDGAIEVSIADDAIYTFIPARNSGIMSVIVTTSSGAAANISTLIDYRASSSPHCVELVDRSALAVGTTALTAGTGDGVDGSLNIAALSDGSIIIKNRIGGQRLVRLTFQI